MIWENNKNFKYKKIFFYFILPLFLLLAIGFIAFNIFNLYKEDIAYVFEPAKVINIDEDFSANIYFNDFFNTKVFSLPIITALEQASDSIELAMYSMDNAEIKESILRAARRGVKVDLLFDDKQEDFINEFFQDGGSSMTIKFADSKSGHMHHKFLIIDRNKENAKLFFGSFNYTHLQEKFDPSFVMETGRPEVVDVFGEEFDRINEKETINLKKTDDYNPFAALINYSDGWLEIWFSPASSENSAKQRMLSLITGAKDDIKAMIWHFTDLDVASALLRKSKKIPVSIITDDYNWDNNNSVFPSMLAQKKKHKFRRLSLINDTKHGQEVTSIFRDGSFNSFLHHHTLILDEKITFFGTNNWSKGGFFRNDESIMISNIDSITKTFVRSYKRNYQFNK